MRLVYFRVTDEELFATQKSGVIAYCTFHNIEIDKEFIENSSEFDELESREGVKLFKTLKKGDELIVFNLNTISNRLGEVVKMFTCLIRKGVNIHITSKNLLINSNISSLILLSLLNEFRQENIKNAQKSKGRPKGRISKSQFDERLDDIVLMLRENISISEMARRLDMNRSSLRDYVNSRDLKALASNQSFENKNEFDIKRIKCPMEQN